MIHSIDIVEEDSSVYKFPTGDIEFVYEPGVGFYILNSEGYFSFEDIIQFVMNKDGSFSLFNDQNVLTISRDVYEQIRELFYKHVGEKE